MNKEYIKWIFEVKCVELAKNLDVSDEYLVDYIYTVLKEFGYYRTFYELNFDGFIRARKIPISSINEINKIKLAKQLSYVPEEFKDYIELGRCNWKGESIFYCSIENGVPIFEIKPQIGDFIAVSHFEHKEKVKTKVITPIIGVKAIWNSYFRNNEVPESNMVTILVEDMQFKTVNSDSDLLLIDDCLSCWFQTAVDGENKYIYRLSTALYHVFIERHINDYQPTAFIYPSVASDITGFNICLSKEFVKDNLELAASNAYYLEDIHEKELKLRVEKQLYKPGKHRRNKIKWVDAHHKGGYFKLHPSDKTKLTQLFK